ncbi:MAG: response regulator [Pseudomonadota bacterium]
MAMVERRAYERVADGPVMKGGAIRFAERHGTIPCVIRDITPAGARVRVLSSAQIPDQFTLIIELDHIEAECTVVWRSKTELGLKFARLLTEENEPPKVAASSPTPLRMVESRPKRASGGNGPIRIIIAEDDPDDRLLIDEAFQESDFSHEIEFVGNGEELLARLADPVAATPGLILLDLNMPKMDGRQALARLKADQETRRIPVIVLTTSNSEEDIERTYDLGVSSYITKPSNFEGLQEIVKHLNAYWSTLVTLPTARRLL